MSDYYHYKARGSYKIKGSSACCASQGATDSRLPWRPSGSDTKPTPETARRRDRGKQPPHRP